MIFQYYLEGKEQADELRKQYDVEMIKAKTAEEVPSRVSGDLGLASALAFLCVVLEEFPVSGSQFLFL